ncbi:hypothetical protein HYC85_025109 [Camellia sinensis]|uniref:Uncharacterized protein n=1 Tax=Camellia sinensis TaxID=4442 RepID=A0A7J7GA06_CAMSI|nr:hypothetical protein HYC85_025109 [Camellia sinensis]
MSRPMLLVFLLIILIITSQFEWKQQLVSDIEANPNVSQKQQQISKREEAVKEKKRTFRDLMSLYGVFGNNLLQCRSNNDKLNGTVSSLTESVIDLERQQILED